MQSLTYSAIALLLVVMNACIPAQGLRNGNSDSLLASTDGFAKEDLTKLKPEHITLSCSKDGAPAIDVKPTKVNEKAMEFPGDKLIDGMDCFLVVRGEVDPTMQYTWLGVDADGKPAVGLFYMSENAKIVAGKLQLPIVKLYSVKPSDHFSANLLTQFQGNEEIPDAKNSEQYQVKLSAELSCLSGTEQLKYRSLPATMVDGQPRLRQFIFNDLSVSKLKTASCSKVSIYEGNNDLIYLAERIAPPLLFTQATVAGTVNLSVSVTKYNAPVPFKRVDPAIVKCVSKDTNNQCTKFELVRADNIWVAEAVILDKSNNTNRRVFVTAPDVSELNSVRIVDVATLNIELLSGLGGFSTYKVYNQSAQSMLLARDFDKKDVSSLAAFEENFTFSNGQIEFQFFLNIFVHGMHQVNPESQALNTGVSANERWLALVDIKAGDKTEAQVIIAGGDQYYGSARLANGKLFDWADVSAELKKKSFKYEVFTYADAMQGVSGLNCGTPIERFIDHMSGMMPTEMTYEQSELNYCKLNDFPAVYLDGHTAEAKVYVYGWQKY